MKAIKCMRCEIRDPLVVHHKDRNPSNNRLDNLEVLCPNCHYREHGTGNPVSMRFQRFRREWRTRAKESRIVRALLEELESGLPLSTIACRECEKCLTPYDPDQLFCPECHPQFERVRIPVAIMTLS